MKAISIHDAKTQFSRLVARAEAGEEIIVRRGPTPVVKIVALHPIGQQRRPGRLKGQIAIGPDFDAPLDDFDDLA
jgi:prevent-host-death family protein